MQSNAEALSMLTEIEEKFKITGPLSSNSLVLNIPVLVWRSCSRGAWSLVLNAPVLVLEGALSLVALRPLGNMYVQDRKDELLVMHIVSISDVTLTHWEHTYSELYCPNVQFPVEQVGDMAVAVP